MKSRHIVLVLFAGFFLCSTNASAQWKLASGFTTTFGLYDHDQADGFISWGDSLLAHGLCQTDPSQSPAPPDSLFLSTDHGQTWTNYSSGVLPVFIYGAGPNAVFYATMTQQSTNISGL